MARPENFKQILVADYTRIEINLYCFRMIPQKPVSRILLCAAGVSYAGSDDSFYTPEPGVRSPESPEAERGRFE